MFLFLPLIYLFDRNLITKIIYESHFFFKVTITWNDYVSGTFQMLELIASSQTLVCLKLPEVYSWVFNQPHYMFQPSWPKTVQGLRSKWKGPMQDFYLVFLTHQTCPHLLVLGSGYSLTLQWHLLPAVWSTVPLTPPSVVKVITQPLISHPKVLASFIGKGNNFPDFIS